MKRLDPSVLQREIEALIVAYPELAEDESLRHDMLEGSTNLHEQLTVLVNRLGEAQAMVAGIESYVTALRGRAARLERRIEAQRKLIHRLMDAANLRKIELACATLSIKNGVARIIITNEHELPERFFRVRREPIKAMIKTEIEAGNPIPGAELSNAEPVLSIRIV